MGEPGLDPRGFFAEATRRAQDEVRPHGLWAAEMREHGFSEEEIAGIWETGRAIGLRAAAEAAKEAEREAVAVCVVCPECSAIYTPDVAGINARLAKAELALERCYEIAREALGKP